MPKTSALADLTTFDGVSYVYDPDLIVALANASQRLPDGNLGKLIVHVCGVAAAPLPIEGTAEEFLVALNIQQEFVKLTGKNGHINVRAKAVSFLLSHEPGAPDPAIKTTVHFASDPVLHFYAYEDVATVRRLIDEVRSSEDGD
jgi:hypothetical protein